MNYYSLIIKGKDLSIFIKNLYLMNISIYNIIYNKDNIIIKVNNKDYKKIIKIKTIYDIKIDKYYGFNNLKHFINKYKIFLICIIIAFLSLNILSNIIFSIEINTSNIKLKEELKEELDNLNIKKYKLMLSYSNKEKAKKKLLNIFKDKISFLEINRIGTKYYIDLIEKKSKQIIDDNKFYNIVAKKMLL